MSDELVFTSRPKPTHIPEIPFTLDEQKFVAHAPKRAAWAALLAARRGGPGDMLQAVGMFLDACLAPEDQYVIEHRLRDQRDDLDIEDLVDVVEALMREWEPYLSEEMAQLTGNRATRRQAAKRTPARRPARRTTEA